MIEVLTARPGPLLDGALDLRRRVFVDEQSVPAEAEFDWLDESAEHLVAVDKGRVLGTCRLVADRKQMILQRVAVEPDARGRGIASMLVEAAKDRAREAGAERLDMHAQLHAVGVYERAGFSAHGEPFDEDGIEHVAMTLELR